MLTGRNYDFMLPCPNAQKSQVILRVNVADHATSLGRQLVYQPSVLHCGGVIQRGPHRYTCKQKK